MIYSSIIKWAYACLVLASSPGHSYLFPTFQCFSTSYWTFTYMYAEHYCVVGYSPLECIGLSGNRAFVFVQAEWVLLKHYQSYLATPGQVLLGTQPRQSQSTCCWWAVVAWPMFCCGLHNNGFGDIKRDSKFTLSQLNEMIALETVQLPIGNTQSSNWFLLHHNYFTILSIKF